MLSEEQKLAITNEVVQSETFSNSPTGQSMLLYLVKANIGNRFLKEGIIDIEFFGGKPDVEKSTPKVRVNIYNLRKKLERYYQNEGINSDWRISIEKGQYGVTFEKQNTTSFKVNLPLIKVVVPYALLFLSVIALVFSHLPSKAPIVWQDYLNNDKSTNLYIGDAFGYGGKTISGLGGWTRDFEINSRDDYYKLLEDKPELKLSTRLSEICYSTSMAENATHDLARLFTKWDSDFSIKYATQASFAEIKEKNAIYIGRVFNQQDFLYLFNEANPLFSITDKAVHFSGNNHIGDTIINFSTNSMDVDLTVVSRLPGPNNTEQFLFFSNHDIGVIAAVEYFTNTDYAEAFASKNLNQSPYFTAIMKATGKERTSLKLETLLVVPN